MKYVLSLLATLITCAAIAQKKVEIQGYVYETGNRGYVSGVNITLENKKTDQIIGKAITDADGFFKTYVPHNTDVRLYATKEMFDVKKLDLPVERGDVFVKLEIGRKPGYKFEVTLAEARDNENIIVDAIRGARIEVYNNTKRESVMDLKEHMSPEFQLNLEKGNHYTILIRKEGYLSKRMEAKVDVEGCILCFEGVGTVNPGVADNLTENNAFGVLLANVELERIFTGKKMEVQNLYYASSRWNLDKKAKEELSKVITLMKDNPNLTIELGAHTDSQGKKGPNLVLSQKRAKSAVDYLIMKGDIAKSRIVSKGYGEMNLLNDCGDGSNCTAKEHAVNRRTELKIVGITNVSKVKSLAKMKQEEYMEEQILGLMDQEEVRAESIEDLEKRLNNEVSEEATQNEVKHTENLATENKLIPSKESENNDLENDEISIPTEDIKEIKNEVPTKESLPLKDDVASIKIEQEDILKASEEEEEEEIKKSSIDLTKKTDKKKATISDDMPGLEVVDPKSKIDNSYKIVLYRSTEPLSEMHPMFKQHNNVTVFRDTDKTFNYMIGDFDKESEAAAFFKTYIKSQYKDSFLARIKNKELTRI